MAIVATHVSAVQELYVAYFGRPADPAGLDYWTNVVAANAGSTAAVSATFAASPEYIVTYYGKSNTEIVDQIYTNLFNRPADAAGRAYWVDLLAKGTIKVDTIVAEVANAALTTDAERVENKVAAATAFTTALNTPAEVAGYTGFDAIAAAKAFVATVTTDATLTSAIAPAALDISVAAVVKAGTPFSLSTAVTELRAADKAMADFVKANNLTGAGTVEAQADARVTAAEGALAAAVPTYTGSTAVKAAALADAQKALATALTTANTELADARTAAGSKVISIVDAEVRAQASVDQAELAQVQTTGALLTAESVFEATTGGVAAVSDTAISFTPAGGTSALLININTTTGVATLAPGVTETTNPGVTALLNAARADAQADLVVKGATDALTAATNARTSLTGTELTNANKVITEVGEQQTAADNAAALTKLVGDLTTAKALVTQFDKLDAAVDTANADFIDAGYLAPAALNGSFVAALTGSDVFTLGSADDVTLTNFGTNGDDVIFIGNNFTLNAGAVSTGVDTAMEVFFIQNGANAEVHVEKAAYGSTSDDVIVISLIGVDATDLQLTNGVISMKDGAA